MQNSVVVVVVMDETFVVGDDDFFLFGLDTQVLAVVIRHLYYNFHFRLHLVTHVIENEEWEWVFRHRIYR